MSKGAFKCPKCDRTFAMAAHLARHTNSMHGRGRPRGGRKRAGAARRIKTVRAAGAVANGADASRVLSEMKAYRDTLLVERSAIEDRLAGLETALSAMGSAPSIRIRVVGRRGPGRPRGSTKRTRRARRGSLKQMIVKVLRARPKPLSPQEIADGVVRAGYKTSSQHLTKSVSNTLPNLAEVKKVGRGLYQAT